MSKLSHCSKRTTVLLIIQISILIGAFILGIVGRVIHNDLMKECMDIMPLLLCIMVTFGIVGDKYNFKRRHNSVEKQNIFWLVLGLVLSFVILVYIICIGLLLS